MPTAPPPPVTISVCEVLALVAAIVSCVLLGFGALFGGVWWFTS
jgi:hypothetical protein